MGAWRTTYQLEAESEGKRSGHGFNGCMENDVPAGGGERGQEVRSWIQWVHGERRTTWRRRARARGQVMDSMGAWRTTYTLEAESEGKSSGHGFNGCMENDVHAGGGERGQEFRSW